MATPALPAAIIRRQQEHLEDEATRRAVQRLDEAIVQLGKRSLPIGVVLSWRGVWSDAGVPVGWLRCITDPTGSYAIAGGTYEESDTAAPGPFSGIRLLIADHPRLYGVIGNLYGGKVALGEFRLPDELPETRIIKT